MTSEEGVRRAIALYAQHHDNRDADGYVSLFAANGVFRFGDTSYAGTAAIREFIEGFYTARPERRTKHAFVNSVLMVEGNTATALSDVLVYDHNGDGAWTFAQTLRHADRLIQIEDAWLFTEKKILTV